ncbi:MAG: hypothetical protein M0Z85_00455 [Gammaproteobacteria bacterium]|nr:hypothetical protein [Gammaproteobacteria bacterium]
MDKALVRDCAQNRVVLAIDGPCSDQFIRDIGCSHQRYYQINLSRKKYDGLCLHTGNSHKATYWLAARIEEVITQPDITIEQYVRVMMRNLWGSR